MIKTLEIERFKSISRLSIDCGKVNVFVGAPDTGKTTILESLQLLSCLGWGRAIGSNFRLTHEIGFQNLFYRNFLTQGLRIAADKMELTAHLHSPQALQVRAFGNEPIIAFDSTWHHPALNSIRYYLYSPATSWAYRTDGPANVVAPPSGSNLIYVARHDEKVYEYLRELVAQLGFKLRFDPNLKRFSFCEVREDDIFDYSLELLSDSVKRMFFYTAVVSTSKEAVLVMDEPDVLAFPPYPKNLGEMIALDESNNQFFLTTHNPYFLSALVEKTPQKDLALFVCDRAKDGATTATRVKPERMARVVEAGASVFFNLNELVSD